MSETLLCFTVHGEPAPQGSRTRLATGGMREDNPDTLPWRNAIAAAAIRVKADDGIFSGPLRLVVTFVFARPKAHYRTGKHAGQLKPSAPIHCDKRPDLDKLCRAIGDALTGIAIYDDAQIVELVASKRYGQPAAHIVIKRAN